MRGLEKRLAAGSLSEAEQLALHIQLCVEKARFGDTKAAVQEIETAAKLLPPELPELNPRLAELLARFYLVRAVAYMRDAEVSNCVAHHTSQSCILPIRESGIHPIKEPGLQAKASLLDYLRLKPDDLMARWLLNIVCMTIGEYPRGVSESLRIDFNRFQSDHDVGRFVDIAPELGINTFSLAGGVVAEDLDGDGFLDIVVSSADPEASLTCYRNLGTGSFQDVTARSGLQDQLGGLNLIDADYDNDGDMDLLVLRGAWLHKGDGEIRKSLLRNNGDGTFTDVTWEAGLASTASPSQACAWGDLDNDGDLDLYCGNESPVDEPVHYPSQLFRNNGDGTFTEVAAEAGVTNDRFAKGVAFGDYDNDGDLDIYVSNVGENRLYRNDGGLRFTDVAPALGLTEPKGRSFAPWFFDYNNDGWLDIWVGAYDAPVASIAADYLGLPHHTNAPCLYRNNGDGTFTNVAERMGLDHPYLPMGANFGDLDNDGFLDIYLGTGDPDYRTLVPNVMLRNDRGERFQDVTVSGGFGHLQKGHGIAFADLDNDGDQDIYHELGGFLVGDKFGNAMFLNPGHGNHFLDVKLVGRESNRAGVGARIKLVVETPAGVREIHRAVGCVSSFGGSPIRRQEIGLGDAKEIRKLEIWWPKSGQRQSYEGVPLDGFVEVTEGAAEFKILPLRKIVFPVPR